MGIKVYDINTSEFIDGAKVSVSQDCRINEYPLSTFGFTNSYGFVKTFDLSNQEYQVKVEKNNIISNRSCNSFNIERLWKYF